MGEYIKHCKSKYERIPTNHKVVYFILGSSIWIPHTPVKDLRYISHKGSMNSK